MPIGVPELLIILVVVLVIFGPKRLPGLGKQLGTGMREFKDSISGDDKHDKHASTTSLDAAPEDRPEAGEAFAQRESQRSESGTRE